ncbi:MAG: hypothetical protein ACK4RK_03705 [Gemmataceae bacterium]
MPMNQAWILFALLLAIWCVLGAVLWVEETSAGGAAAHPHFQTMDQGGSGQLRHGPLLGQALALGVLEIAVFVAFLGFGIGNRPGAERLRRRLLLGGLLYTGVFALVVWTYQNFLAGDQEVFIGPFPAPTALMLFGMYLAPYYFVILYVVSFDRWIARPEDLAAFQKLVAARRRHQGGEDD